MCACVYNNKSKTYSLVYDITIHTDTVQEDHDSGPSTERRGRGSRGRGRGRGRGSSGRGRGTASRLGGVFTPSTLAWEDVDVATDTAPSSLPFTRTSESTVTLDPTASPCSAVPRSLP